MISPSILSLCTTFGFFKQAAASINTSTTGMIPKLNMSTTSNSHSQQECSDIKLETRLRNALWGFFAGDALAMPTHWYYGGFPQIQSDYGPRGIVGYTQPVATLPGSILNKSNINGGGRGSFSSSGSSIIGDVILHGKREYWDPARQTHYHATLQRGENTLEVQLARVLMRSIVEREGVLDADHFRNAYVTFMTTPGSHHDTYASTCHRMFFANMVYKKLPPDQCPDNDHHNVDTIDGLVLPTITALAMAASSSSSTLLEDETEMNRIAEAAAATVAVTRNSKTLEGQSKAWSRLVVASLHRPQLPEHDETSLGFPTDLETIAKSLGMRRNPSRHSRDEMTACYLDSSVPSTLDMVAKYTWGGVSRVWEGLLANANVGGENVHRGSILGAILGARVVPSATSDDMKKLQDGLYNRKELQVEIDAFVKAVLKK
jgi:ADP-ribosylglycohydrolase